MPDSQTAAFSLLSHPLQSDPPACRLSGEVARSGGMLRVGYRLEGELGRLSIPQAAAGRFADELWQHTCFELFVALPGVPSYHEFNFSPSGDWAVYAFDRYRQRAFVADAELAALKPELHCAASTAVLELSAQVSLSALSPRHGRSALRLGLSAVLERKDGSAPLLSYWALVHPDAKPDFHHPESFALTLDEIRN